MLAEKQTKNWAFVFVQRLAADLSADKVELPGFPDVVVKLQKVLGADDSSAQDIMRIIMSEPALMARLIHLANAAAFSRGGTPVGDIRTAVTKLGFNMVRSTATAYAVEQMSRQEWLKPLRGQLSRIWEESNSIGAICYTVGGKVEGVRADEAMVTGLFHKLGELYLLTHARKEDLDTTTDPNWAETVKSWEPTIARAILDSWGLPDVVGDAVENQNSLLDTNPNDLSVMARLLGAAKLHYQIEGRTDAEAEKTRAIVASVKLTGVSFQDVYEKNKAEIAAVRTAIG